MLYRILTVFGLLLSTFGCSAQEVPERLKTSYAPLDTKLSKMLRVDTRVISPKEASELSNPIYLDARESREYEVSHIPEAKQIGFNTPNWSILAGLPKDETIIVYCTIGYRSQKMVDKLSELGYTKVYNLYGSIYAWSLAGLPLEDALGNPTELVHTYNKKWGTFYPHEKLKVYK